jgi:Domain of unknown function (DUF4351)
MLWEDEKALVLRLLTRKFGEIEPGIRSQVNSLTLDRLEVLGESLLDFTQMSDLVSWLDTDSP